MDCWTKTGAYAQKRAGHHLCTLLHVTFAKHARLLHDMSHRSSVAISVEHTCVTGVAAVAGVTSRPGNVGQHV